MSNIAYIHNLNDLAVWTNGGNHAKARFTWTYSDPDGGSQGAWRVRIYNDSIKTTTLYDSGKTSGTATTCDSTYALVRGTDYYWTLQVWDDMDESSGESTVSAFHVQWGQGQYEFNPGTWGNQAFTSASVPANTYKAIMFRGATDAAAGTPSYGPWVASVGQVDATAYDWLNVMVRLSTTVSGTQPSLANMTLTYTGSTSQPDHWTTSGGSWILDSDAYRYGSRSFKCVVTSNADAPEIYPYRFAVGDDVAVQAETDYMISIFVKTDGALGAGSSLRIRVYAGGSNTTVRATGAAGQTYGDGATSDTSSAPEGWKRLVLRYKTQPAETTIRVKLQYVNGGAGSGDQFWVDAAKQEPGTVASPWAPGWISPAVVIDSFGIAVDGSGGATFRLKNTAGTTDVELDQVVAVADAGAVVYHQSGDPGAVGAGSVWHDTDDDKVYLRDELDAAWIELTGGAGGGAVATDVIWDAKGDLAAGTGANTASKLTVGANDTILMADSTQATGLKWVASAAPVAVGTANAEGTSDDYSRASHVHAHEAAHVAHDTIWDAKGDIVTGSAADTAVKTTVGANDTILMADSAASGGVKWVASAAPVAVGTANSEGTSDDYSRASHVHAHEAAHIAHDTIWDTKGDIVAATGADAASKLAVGTDDYALVADSSQATGLAWKSVSDWDGVLVKAGDESVASSTTVQNDDDFFFTTVDLAVYVIEAAIGYVNSAGSAPDLKMDFGEDANTRGSVTCYGVSTADAASAQTVLTNQTATATFGTATGIRGIYIVGCFRGAGGTWRIRWAQNTSNATATVLKAGSYLKYRRVL